MLRIGYDARRAFKNRTGLGNYARTLLTSLVGLFPQHRFYLYAQGKAQPDPTGLGPEWEQTLRSDSCLVRTDRKPLASWRRVVQSAARHQSDRLDLFHGLSNELPLDIGSQKIASVVTVHDVIYKDFPQTYAWVDRKIYDFKTDKCLRHADLVVAISRFTADKILEHYPHFKGRLEVIPQACAPCYYRAWSSAPSVPPVPGPYWLYVGSLIARKNLMGILKALAAHKPGDRLPLVVLGEGDGPYARQCRHFAQQHSLSVHWVQPRSQDLRLWYRHAVGLIYPSLQEGYGLPVAEALLSECPVLTSERSAMLEACGPHALTVHPEDTEQMSGSMLQLASDSALADRLRVQGKAYALQKLDPSLLAGQWMEAYQTLK